MPTLAARQRLPDERKGISHDFKVGDYEGNLRVGLYPDGTPGEIFVSMSKMGSTVNGLLDSFAIVTSIALQSGVPVEALVSKLAMKSYEPSGRTANPQIPMVSSITAYVFRWLEKKFVEQPVEKPLAQTG